MTKKILVFSDSHGNDMYMNKAMALNPDADLTVHLGDGVADLTSPLPDDSQRRTVLIEGNGEYFGYIRTDRRYRNSTKKTEMIEFEGKKIFMTHGHLFDVKWGLGRITSRGYDAGADIILFGHTHQPLCRYLPAGTELDYIGKTERPLLLFNPGTIGMGLEHTFGLLTFKDGEVLASHGKVK